jgi:DNA-binding CsgD family transcriptional regulator
MLPAKGSVGGAQMGLLLAPAAMLKSNVRAKNAPTLMEVLTPRQFTVAILVASGLKNREISKTMRVSEHVIRNYLRHIFDRSGCWILIRRCALGLIDEFTGMGTQVFH